MLWTIAVILIVLWLLGLVSSYTLGGFIHALLVIAIVVLLIGLIQGRRARGPSHRCRRRGAGKSAPDARPSGAKFAPCRTSRGPDSGVPKAE
jgi:hypothetical protein